MLSWYHRFVFCVPAVAANLLWVLNDYTNYYYVDYVGMDTDILSTATAFNGAAVFLLSPVVAFLSDRKASKIGGERKFLLVLFAFLYSLSNIPLVWIPSGLNDAARESWVTVFTVISSILNAAFELNWAALSMTISHDFRERTLLFGMVNTIGSIASIGGYAILAWLPLGYFVHACILFSALNFLSYAWAASILGVRTSQLHNSPSSNNSSGQHSAAAAGGALNVGSGGVVSSVRSRVRVTLAPAVAAVSGGVAASASFDATRAAARNSATARERRTRPGSPLSPLDGSATAAAEIISDGDEPPNGHGTGGGGLRYHEIKRDDSDHSRTRRAANRSGSSAPPSAVSAAASADVSANGTDASAIGANAATSSAGVSGEEDETAAIPNGESGPDFDEDDDADADAAEEEEGNAANGDGEAEEEEEESGGDELPIVPTLIRTFRNYPFLILFATQTLAYIDPLGPRSQLMKSYAFNAPQKVMALTSTLEQVVVAAATPVFVWCAARWGKKFMYLFLIIGWAAITMSLVLFVQDYESPMYWMLELGTAIFGDTQTVFAQSLLADVVDYDQLLWGGAKRAAIYSCVLSDGQGLDQVTDALQYGLMAAVGFHTSDDATSPGVQRGFRMICFFSAVPSILAFIVFLRYPISRLKHREILWATKRRLKGRAVIDPITKTPLPCLAIRPPNRRSTTDVLADGLSSGNTRAVALSVAVISPPPLPASSGGGAAGSPETVAENRWHQSGLDYYSLWELQQYLRGSLSTLKCAVFTHIMIWFAIFGVSVSMIVYLGINFDLMSIFVSAAAIAIAFEYLHGVRWRTLPTLETYSKIEIALHVDYVAKVLNSQLPASFTSEFLPSQYITGSSDHNRIGAKTDKQSLPTPPSSYSDPNARPPLPGGKSNGFAPLPSAASNSPSLVPILSTAGVPDDWLERPDMARSDSEPLLRAPHSEAGSTPPTGPARSSTQVPPLEHPQQSPTQISSPSSGSRSDSSGSSVGAGISSSVGRSALISLRPATIPNETVGATERTPSPPDATSSSPLLSTTPPSALLPPSTAVSPPAHHS